LAVLKPMTDVVARGALFTQIAQRFGVNEEELRNLAASRDLPRPQVSASQPRREAQSPSALAESELIQLMLVDSQAAREVAEAGIVPTFQQWQELALEIIGAWESTSRIDLGTFLDRLPKELADRVTKSLTREGEGVETEQERRQLLHDCITKIRAAQRRTERERLRREIREAEQKGDEATLRQRLQRLQP
jgi:hypothetical protein